MRIVGAVVVFALTICGGPARFSSEARAQQKYSAPAPSSGTYVLGPTDRVRVKVYGEPDVAGEYEVDAGGYVSVLQRRLQLGRPMDKIRISHYRAQMHH